MHSVALGPAHVPHAASHSSHVPAVAFAHRPSGVQSSTHVTLRASRNGDEAAHVTHASAAGPLQVAQLSWHRTHASACVELPPEHAQPSSTAAHSPSQPSKERRLPSSHDSLPARRPSPHTVAQLLDDESEPPTHSKPGSTAHSALQPSPLTVLLSSQPSAWLDHPIRRPSPHTGEHASRPPTPEPNCSDETHAKPTSTSQSAEQPSPASVLLSSHASAVVRTPSPQTCTGGAYVTASASGVSSVSVAFSSIAVSIASSEASAGSKGVSPSLSSSTSTTTLPMSPTSVLSSRRPPPPPSTVRAEASTTSRGCGPMCAGAPLG